MLGSGGMGRVYLGAVPGKFAAVKRVLPVLAEDPDFLSHFGHELDNLARLPAGANTRLLASDRTAKPPWFATEFIPGITLNEAIRLNAGPLSGGALWRLLREAAAGLRVVHGAAMVHRDLKPSNVMLTGGGLSLIDFGVARAADQSRLTKTGMVIGTPAYMAPEQAVADRQLTGAADVFALGSLLLYAANGRPPFGDGSGPDLLYRVVHGEPDFGRLTEGDPDLAELVRKCLAKDPADRPTADELVALTEEGAAGAVWPEAVAARIAARAAFAAGAPTAEQLEELERTDPARDVATAALTPQAPKEPATASPDPLAVTGQAAPDTPRWRRNKLVMFAVPVVVATGTTLTVALGPYEIGRLGAAPEASSPPSSVASQPASVPPSTGTGTPSAKPSAKPSGKPSKKPPTGSTAPPADASGGGVAGGGGTLSGGSGDAGGGSVTGGGSSTSSGGGTTTSGGASSSGGGSGSGSGSSSGGGSGSGSGSSGGTTTRPTPKPTTHAPAPPPPTSSTPTGTYSLKNASDGTCMGEYNAGYGVFVNTYDCGSAQGGRPVWYGWTYKAGANGTFRLVNRQSGHCLDPNGTVGGTAAACDGSSDQSWRIQATTANGRTLMNVGNGQCLVAGPPFMMMSTCDAGDLRQLWRNVSPV
ncbi:protein kinase [Streptomyces sp. NPDC059695]|uniref:serine/threonine-protein kinase n=1 Tax=Streptomyces sp. NPDC059695 TaxID=3346910 RepID=UPI0036769698